MGKAGSRPEPSALGPLFPNRSRISPRLSGGWALSFLWQDKESCVDPTQSSRGPGFHGSTDDASALPTLFWKIAPLRREPGEPADVLLHGAPWRKAGGACRPQRQLGQGLALPGATRRLCLPTVRPSYACALQTARLSEFRAGSTCSRRELGHRSKLPRLGSWRRTPGPTTHLALLRLASRGLPRERWGPMEIATQRKARQAVGRAIGRLSKGVFHGRWFLVHSSYWAGLRKVLWGQGVDTSGTGPPPLLISHS